MDTSFEKMVVFVKCDTFKQSKSNGLLAPLKHIMPCFVAIGIVCLEWSLNQK